jgi:zinc transport system substrate-binding protein
MRRIALYALILLFFAACDRNKPEVDKPILSASILPQKYFIEQIAGERYEVNILVPPGASPASYEPVPQQIVRLEKSVAYFKAGHIGFEYAWMDKISASNPEMALFDLSEGIELIRGEDLFLTDHDHAGGVDPHTWVSPRRVKIIAENIYRAMVEIDPAREEFYRANYIRFREDLNRLDLSIEQQLKDFEGRSFIIFHPALTYLATDYGIEQIAIEWEGKEPSPGYLMEVIDQAKKKNIHVVFVQEQFDMDNARAIADELDAEVIRINPLDEDWKASVLQIVNSLVHSFQDND